MDLKALETKYRGYTFRSRLEARWAVFFDALSIKWEYEFAGFELNNGKKYLPDFWLPTFSGGMWCEVKPDYGDFSKAIQFANDYQTVIWLCEGTPGTRVYKIANGGERSTMQNFECGIPNFDQARGEDRMFYMPCNYDCRSCGTERSEELDFDAYDSDIHCEYIWAVEKSRSMRFEQIGKQIQYLGTHQIH